MTRFSYELKLLTRLKMRHMTAHLDYDYDLKFKVKRVFPMELYVDAAPRNAGGRWTDKADENEMNNPISLSLKSILYQTE